MGPMGPTGPVFSLHYFFAKYFGHSHKASGAVSQLGETRLAELSPKRRQWRGPRSQEVGEEGE